MVFMVRPWWTINLKINSFKFSKIYKIINLKDKKSKQYVSFNSPQIV